jgi:hypothetical protein
MIFWFVPQNRQLRFSDLGLKIITMISYFGPQKYVGFGLMVAPQNRQMEVDAGHASTCSGLLHLEVSRVRVFQSDIKTVGGVMTDDTCSIIAEVASR